jgi:hypothetical protein
VKLRRDIFLFSAVAISAAAGGWWFLSNRPGAAVDAFQREHRAQQAASVPRLPPADAFRATVCAAGPCVVVEAGGLTFIFGAGQGAAEGIEQLGLMHANIDALLLPDLTLKTVEGLPAVAGAGARAGRREPLKVYGPTGMLPVVDGTNLIVSAPPQARLAAGVEGEDQGAYGRLVFDSGVVTVRGFGGLERGMGRVYRIDFEGRSLILSGCLALPADIIAAARQVKDPGAVVLAGSERLLGSLSSCIDLPTVALALSQAKVSASVLLPADPPDTHPLAAAAWREMLSASEPSAPRIGLPGTVIDMSGEKAIVRELRQK